MENLRKAALSLAASALLTTGLLTLSVAAEPNYVFSKSEINSMFPTTEVYDTVSGLAFQINSIDSSKKPWYVGMIVMNPTHIHYLADYFDWN